MTLGSTLKRPLEAELMDAPNLSLPETERALADLDRIHRWLFGFHASCRALMPRIAKGPRCQVLVDLGTGSGKVSTKVRQIALRRGTLLRIVGVDRKLSHLLYGRRCGTYQWRVVADAEALPFRAAAADWSHSNLLFHHFSPDRNRQILTEMRRVASRGAVVVDLRRAFCSRGLSRLLFPLLRVGRVASYDGKLSTDQAWCMGEVRQMTADLPVQELRRRFPFRFSLVLPAGEKK